MQGEDYLDTLCIGSTKFCIKDFRFFSATHVDERIVPMAGIAGLGPDHPDNPPSFIAAMYDQKLIEKKMFGFIFGSGDFHSQITFGGYDEAKKLT